MDFEPWWLIIVPVLFALGWIAARVDIRQMLSETRSLPKSYFKGLNFLLNEEPDRAIDAFVEVAKLDPETTELHFALGSLFRRRGEMERAIRVHHSLLARADLPPADREMAEHELAHDYLKAGMLDRAETAFTNVLDTRYAVDAIRSLIRIYESGHEWTRAIDAVKKLQALVDEPVPQLVHYQCEQAEAALAQSTPDVQAASSALDAADHAADVLGDQEYGHASKARIAMLRARLAAMSGNTEGQRAYLASIFNTAPEYGSLVANELLSCYRELGQAAEGLVLLQAHYQHVPSLDTFNVVFRELRAQKGHVAAWEFAREALRTHPSLLGLDRVLESELAAAARESSPKTDAQADAGAEDAATQGFAKAGAHANADGASARTLPAGGADLGLLRSIIHKHTQRLDR